MICYKDKCFCGFYINCKGGMDCDRALTTGVAILAQNAGLFIDQFATPPEKCYRELTVKRKGLEKHEMD